MNRIATLVGCAIGDALGNPFEMHAADSQSLQLWNGSFIDGGTFWKGKAGQYTDDTLMSMALSASLIEHRTFIAEDVASKYLSWYQSGNTRGIGNTTAQALHNLKQGTSWEESGVIFNPNGQPVGGNGTAMRAAPIGLVFRHDLPTLLEVAIIDASITHNSHEPKMGSCAVALSVALLANQEHSPISLLEEIKDVITESVVQQKLELAFNLIQENTSHSQALAKIGTSGYVPETIGAAFYCFAATSSFRDAVVLAVKAGGDTDTIAAIVGSLAGTYYGLDDIPEEYKSVEQYQLLLDLTDELLDIDVSEE